MDMESLKVLFFVALIFLIPTILLIFLINLKDKFFENIELNRQKKEFDLKVFGVRVTDDERKRRVKEIVAENERKEAMRKIFEDNKPLLDEMHEIHEKIQSKEFGESLRRTSPYYVLGISEQATPEEIREAYKRKCLENHPDRTAGLGEEYKQLAEMRMTEINNAYDILRKG